MWLLNREEENRCPLVLVTMVGQCSYRRCLLGQQWIWGISSLACLAQGVHGNDKNHQNSHHRIINFSSNRKHVWWIITCSNQHQAQTNHTWLMILKQKRDRQREREKLWTKSISYIKIVTTVKAFLGSWHQTPSPSPPSPLLGSVLRRRCLPLPRGPHELPRRNGAGIPGHGSAHGIQHRGAAVDHLQDLHVPRYGRGS